jgi:hypothetical protein
MPLQGEDMKKGILLVFAIAVILGLVAVARAGGPGAAGPRPRCHRVFGSSGIRSHVVSVADGCTSPVGLCTAGEFHGDPVLAGPTSFVADGVTPAAGMPGVEAPTTLSYSGLLTITTRWGTLTTRDTGIFDTAAGLFSSRDVVVSGTGLFAGATGHLFFHGTGTTSFDSVASGEICFAR